MPSHLEKPYARNPLCVGDRLMFLCADSLWSTSLQGGPAYRIAPHEGVVDNATCAPSQTHLAYTAVVQGNRSVYVHSLSTGQCERLTYWNGTVSLLGWQNDRRVLVGSNHNSAFSLVGKVFSIDVQEKGDVKALNFENVHALSFEPQGLGRVVQRWGYGYEKWRKYRGGLAGQLWIDRGEGWSRLVTLQGNQLAPQWVGHRIYFLSDHEGVGNVYSCTTQGDDLRAHSTSTDFYVQSFSVREGQLFYGKGGDLFSVDLSTGAETPLSIALSSSGVPCTIERKEAEQYLTSVDLSADAKTLLVTTRGRVFHMSCLPGWVKQKGEADGECYRFASFLDESTVIYARDVGKKMVLETRSLKTGAPIETFTGDWGRIVNLRTIYKKKKVVLVSHNYDLLVFNLETGILTKIDRALAHGVSGFDVSPDGKWVVYSLPLSHKQAVVRLYNCHAHTTHDLTRVFLEDTQPIFDSTGRFIYLLSGRTLDMTGCDVRINATFLNTVKPYIITLRKDDVPPFHKLYVSGPDEEEEADKNAEPQETVVDLEGILDRMLELPVPTGNYLRLASAKNKLFWIRQTPADGQNGADVVLERFDLTSLKTTKVAESVQDFFLSRDRNNILVQTETNGIRVLKTDAEMEEGEENFGFDKGGWVALDRIALLVDPQVEWALMFNEAWRAARDFFWNPEAMGASWDVVYDRYKPLLKRIRTYSEFFGLLQQLQGELGTSHAYVFPTDAEEAAESGGSLGTDVAFDHASGAYRIEALRTGYPWFMNKSCPLRRPGVNLQTGDLIYAVNGKPVSAALPLEASFRFSDPETPLCLTVKKASDKHETPKTDVLVFPIRSNSPLCYADWVEKNRAYVHEQTNGKVGYVHIPEMSFEGFAAFYSGFVLEHQRDGLIVDVRHNGGGFTSPMIYDVLLRPHLGHDRSRMESAVSYMEDATSGAMALLISEDTGSDGDMFTHTFKTLKLGPIIGRRTWGGVVAMFSPPRVRLMDGTSPVIPEMAFWSNTVQGSIENHGVDPDIAIDNPTEIGGAEDDLQLAQGVRSVLEEIEKKKKGD